MLPLVTLTGWRYALLALLFVAAVGIIVALDLLAAASLYLRFVAVYTAFWVLIGGLLLRDTPVRLQLMLLVVFVAQVAAIHFVNWNSRKPFFRDFDRITEGMTEAQVDGIMGHYIKETDLPPIPLEEGDEAVEAVVCRHTDESWGEADWGIVAFEGGRVGQKALFTSAFSNRPTPPGADAAAGTVGQASYVLLQWKEGLTVMIWHDFSESSRGSGSTSDPIYRYEGYAESPGGRRFDWEAQTADRRHPADRILQRQPKPGRSNGSDNRKVQGEPKGAQCDFGHDGRWLATDGTDSLVHVWDLERVDAR